MKKPENLNFEEYAVLISCESAIQAETGGDLGYGSDVELNGLSKRQIAGFLSQLVQKGYIVIDEYRDRMMTLTAKGEQLLRE